MSKDYVVCAQWVLRRSENSPRIEQDNPKIGDIYKRYLEKVERPSLPKSDLTSEEIFRIDFNSSFRFLSRKWSGETVKIVGIESANRKRSHRGECYHTLMNNELVRFLLEEC